MPPFRYDAYRNPYGPSIAEAIAQQGTIDAAGALRAGNLQADAAQQRGAIQAQMFGTVGQALADIPQQMRANKALALREQQQQREMAISQMHFEDAQRQREAEGRIGAAYESARGADGSVDFDKFQAAIPGADMRYAQPQLAAADQSATRRQALTAKKLAAVQDVAGGMLQSGDLSPASVTEFLHLGRQNGVFTDEQVAAHTQAMTDDPNAAKRLLLGIVGPQKPIEQDADKALVHPLTGDVIRPAPGKVIPDEFKQADNVVGPKGEPLFYNTKKAWFQDAAGNRVTDVRIGRTAAENLSVPEQELDAYAKSLGKPDRTALNYTDLQAFEKNKEAIKASAAFQAHVQNRNYDNQNQPPEKPKKQADLEQQYRTVLRTAMSNRSGGIGAEDAKVAQANHLLSLLEADFDPKTGTYSIPVIQQKELALGLARLVSPGGQAGVQMLEEVNQRTAKGDMADWLTYLTGRPVNGSPQALVEMYKKMIERQGQTAAENRDTSLAYLRGLAPTELEESRRQQLEAADMLPLRQSRLVHDPATGAAVLEVSRDNGRTWARSGGTPAAAPATTTGSANPFRTTPAAPTANPFRR